MDRPEASNALSQQVVAELRAAVATAVADPEVRALVLGGAGGKIFCAGADLKERRGMTLAETRAFLDDLNALMNEIAATPKPSVAALSGSAFGGGLELALACDLRVAVEQAQLGLLEVRVGIMPGAGGTQRLPRLVGLGRAKELILLGRRISARRALEMGLVNEVVAAGALDDAVEAVCAELAGCAPIAVGLAKRAIDDGFAMDLPAALALERELYERTLATEDRQEGLRAFAEKRPPVFRGR
jgi:enoyl-CoA hydratase/carnithine racemase